MNPMPQASHVTQVCRHGRHRFDRGERSRIRGPSSDQIAAFHQQSGLSQPSGLFRALESEQDAQQLRNACC